MLLRPNLARILLVVDRDEHACVVVDDDGKVTGCATPSSTLSSAWMLGILGAVVSVLIAR